MLLYSPTLITVLSAPHSMLSKHTENTNIFSIFRNGEVAAFVGRRTQNPLKYPAPRSVCVALVHNWGIYNTLGLP